jgi:hypothetical protein
MAVEDVFREPERQYLQGIAPPSPPIRPVVAQVLLRVELVFQPVGTSALPPLPPSPQQGFEFLIRRPVSYIAVPDGDRAPVETAPHVLARTFGSAWG